MACNALHSPSCHVWHQKHDEELYPDADVKAELPQSNDVFSGQNPFGLRRQAEVKTRDVERFRQPLQKTRHMAMKCCSKAVALSTACGLTLFHSAVVAGDKQRDGKKNCQQEEQC